MIRQLLMTGRDLFLMLCDMANEVYNIFTRPLKDAFGEDTVLDGWLMDILDSILEVSTFGDQSLMTLMFGSGIVVVLLVILKNFIL